MESKNQLKQQAFNLFNKLTAIQMQVAIDILKLVASDEKIQIHLPQNDYIYNDNNTICYSNVSSDLIQVTQNDSHIGPKEIPNNMYYDISIDRIFLEYYETNGERFNEIKSGCVLRSLHDVFPDKTDNRVVYKGFICYYDNKNTNSVFELFISLNDYNKKINGIWTAQKNVFRMIPIEKASEECRLYKEHQDQLIQNIFQKINSNVKSYNLNDY